MKGTSKCCGAVAAVLLWGVVTATAAAQPPGVDLDQKRVDLDHRFLGFQSNVRLGEELTTEARSGNWMLELHSTFPALAAARVDLSEEEVQERPHLTEALMSYRVKGLIPSLEFLAGLRFRGTDLSLDLEPMDHDADPRQDMFRPVIGGRFRVGLSNRWHLGIRGDLQGIGSRSGLTWRAAGLFGYKWRENRSLLLGYRVLGLDFSEGNRRRVIALDWRKDAPVLELDIRF